MLDKDMETILDMFPISTILIAYRGSIAHNMYVPNTDPHSIDDIDLMAVFMAPVDKYIGLAKSNETIEKFEGKYDIVSYEFRKTIKLLLNNNPNVLTLLHIKPNHYLYTHPDARLLIDNRDLFSSKKVYNSFTGYAKSQLKGMEKFNFEGYMGKKRKALVKEFGFDIKMAAHCIRLLRMGIEFLKTGKLNVYRDDAEELLDIKLGKRSLQSIKLEANGLFYKAKKAFSSTDLPEEPNYKEINKLTRQILYRYVRNNYDDRS